MLILTQHIPLGHDVLSFIPPDHSALLQHFNGVKTLISIATCQKYFAERSAAQDAQKLEITRL